MRNFVVKIDALDEMAKRNLDSPKFVEILMTHIEEEALPIAKEKFKRKKENPIAKC